ncbi:MAG TPA: hypothetical protein VFV50_06950 [Bdellovibrionales bacterium]|nr:hypothetical protein [Bdellovibrionales bacterium]
MKVLADKRAVVIGAIVVFAALVSELALAQAQNAGASKGSAAASRKKTKVDFEDQLIEGEVKRPELMSILQKKQYNFGRLIKLRENFLPEMRKTGEAVQRRGGTSE